MLKWFRQYEKIILGIGGAILMVVFLIPGVDMFRPDFTSGQSIGRIGDRDLTVADQQAAAVELDLLRAAQQQVFIHARTNPRSPLPPGLQELARAQLPDDALHWVLLMEEAKSHGIYVPQIQAEQVVRDILASGIDLQRIYRQGSVEAFTLALAHWQMYAALAEMMFGSSPPSDPRVRHFARDIHSRVKLRLVALDPGKVIEKVSDPTEPQIKEHFEKYKAKKPGETEPYGWGYLLPSRVKLEYLAIPLKRVAATIKIDEVQAYRHYMDHKGEFLPPPPPPPSQKKEEPAKPTEGAPEKEESKPATESKPAQQPPAKPETKKEGQCDQEPATELKPVDPQELLLQPAKPVQPLSYTEVRAKIIEKLTDEQARARQSQIVKFIQAQLNKPIASLPTDEQGYKQLLGHQPVSLNDLAQKVQKEYGLLPDVTRIENRWLTLKDVSELEGLGKASLEVSGRPLPVAAYVASLRELKLPQAQAIPTKLQINLPSQPVTDTDDNAYFFRVIAADGERQPKDLGEVKDRVVADLKELARYQALMDRRKSLLDRLEKEGLEPLAKQYKTEVKEAGPFTKVDQFMLQFTGRMELPDIPEVGRSEAFVKAVFEQAGKIADAGGLEKAAPSQLVSVVGVDRTRKVYLVKIAEYQPVDSAMFDILKFDAPQLIAMSEMQKINAGGPLSLETVKKRTGFVSAGEEKKPAEKSQPRKEPAKPQENPAEKPKP